MFQNKVNVVEYAVLLIKSNLVFVHFQGQWFGES